MTEQVFDSTSTFLPRRCFVIRALTLAVYAIAILVLGTLRSGSVPGMNFVDADKLLHGLVFGGLAVLTYRLASTIWPRRGNRWYAVVGVVTATGFGVFLEVVQSFTRYRSAEFGDVIADLLGAILLASAAVALRLERPHRLFFS